MKIGDKIICIDERADWRLNLTYGKTYIVNSFDNDDMSMVYVRDDNFILCVYRKRRFITVPELRRMKLERILQ